MDANLQKAIALIVKEFEKSAVTTKGLPSTTPTTTYGHGNGGLFSYPGISRPVFSAMVLPRLGLQTALPVRPSANDQNPLYAILTGVTASSGSEPEGVCDDPPSPGLTKLCTHTFVFGRMSRQTRVFELDRMGLTTNRGEFWDLQLMNQPLWLQGNPQVPTIPGAGFTDVVKSEVAKALFELGVAWSRDFATDLYQGNPANNTGGGGRKYYHGLNTLINTGYRDAITGQACPAADSVIRSFGNLDVATNGNLLVRTVVYIMRELRDRAARMGLDPATWAIAMPWSMFYEITEIWPCAYMTYRCNSYFSAGQPQVTSSEALIAMRDAMRGDIYTRTGQFLLVDGVRVPVIIDDAIAETEVAGQSFRAPMYFVPLTVLGGTPVTFLEYINYDAPNGAMEAARAFAPDGFYYTSDAGRFLWHKKPPANFCVQLLAKTEPRLLLLTPQVAARLNNVQYTPFDKERSYDPANTSFFTDGGRTDYVGYGPSFYSPTVGQP